jgi:trans-aconitate 2-methyltransferase
LGATVVGIDRSIEMIAAAKKNFPQLRFEVVDAAQLSFDNEFDAVFSNAALHWVRDSQGAVASVARALKPGGRFVFEMGGSGNIRTLSSTIVEALWSLGLEQAERLSPWYYPSVAGYATLLESQGLEVTFATLFDRPTALDGGELGLRTWIETMGNFLLQTIPPDQRETFVCRVETLARPALFHDGVWSADYRRLRMIARKVQPEA